MLVAVAVSIEGLEVAIESAGALDSEVLDEEDGGADDAALAAASPPPQPAMNAKAAATANKREVLKKIFSICFTKPREAKQGQGLWGPRRPREGKVKGLA